VSVVITLIVIAVVVLLIVFWVIGLYNGLARARIRVKEAWSGIDVQLKRLETVKGYAAHEDKLFRDIAELRAKSIGGGTVG